MDNEGADAPRDTSEHKDGGGSSEGGGGAADSKPSSEHLSLKVKSQDGNEVYFKVKRTTQFSKVMTAYCKKVGQDLESVRFLFDGQRLNPQQTPADLDMEDEDEIDAMVQQTGGARGGGRARI